MSICELTDLPSEMCAHCRGLAGPAERDTYEVDAYALAKFSGRCPACDGPIRSGDWVGHTDAHGGMWVCRRCGI